MGHPIYIPNKSLVSGTSIATNKEVDWRRVDTAGTNILRPMAVVDARKEHAMS
jgi:hypothetical protein